MRKIYTLSETAREIEVPGLGRNKLYRILKTLGIVDYANRPVQKYINEGLLTRPRTGKGGILGTWKSNVTLVVDSKGIDFIKWIVLEFVQRNPIPTFPHRPKVSSGTNI
jgi:hypothetical protein